MGSYDCMDFKTCYKQDPYRQTMILMKWFGFIVNVIFIEVYDKCEIIIYSFKKNVFSFIQQCFEIDSSVYLSKIDWVLLHEMLTN